MEPTILVVDDEERITRSLAGILSDEGYRVQVASSGTEALKKVEDDLPDLVLLDIWMPGLDGMEVLQRLKEKYPNLQIIIISGHGNIETAVKATKLGAFDFIEKPLSIDKITVSVKNALNFSRLEQDNIIWRETALRRHELTGKSLTVQRLREQIKLVAPTNSTVLITGENGTGKELVARAIHYRSARQNRPLIEVNCAAIPEELIESELFGHEKGAFTGAVGKKPGRFDLANGGTLFLDEIGDMSLKTQAKVLRILEEQRFERVGGSKTISVDVRIIAATNKNLKKEIEEGRFREDLFYRLNVIPIKVPPLRERLEDIPLLVDDFLEELARESGLGRKTITDDAINILQRYHWPGNVRELRNLVERLVILTPGKVIDKQQLLRLFDAEIHDSNKKLSNIYEIENLKEARAYFEKEFIRRKLEKNSWNISLTAQKIGIERTHLYRKMKAYGLGVE